MGLFFSVIIPLHNKESSILETVKSILNQTYTEFELIIINDGSTDRSVKILSELKDTRVRIINKSNGGVSSARNLGIQSSTGDYCAFIDADDLWKSEFLSTMYKLIITNPQASFFGCQLTYKDGAKEFIVNKMHDFRGQIEFFEKSIIAPVVSSSSIVIKRSCFEEVGLFDVNLARGEDLEFWWRLACNYKIAFEPTPLVIYVQDSNNRACKKVLPLEKYFLPQNLSFMSKEQKSYALKLITGVAIEMAYNDNYKILLKLLKIYKAYAFKIYVTLLLKKVMKIIFK